MISGSAASLRPRGIGRYFGAVFLSIWLVGWLIGEIVAVGLLAVIFSALSGMFAERLPAAAADFASSGVIGFVVLFVLVWLTLWTFGGIAAWTHLLRSIAGEDSIALQGSEFELVRRAGPFRRRYAFARSAVRRIRLRPHDKALVADTTTGTQLLTQFGTVEERHAIRDWLRRHLLLADEDLATSPGSLPGEWEVTSDGGSTILRKVRPRARAIRSVIAWLVSALVSAGWLASVREGTPLGSIPALALTLLAALGAAISTWGRREWIVRPGEVTFRRSFLIWNAVRTFKRAKFEVTHHTDSDNDSHYKLVIADGEQRKTIHSQMNDANEVVDLARWMTARAGFPLTLPRALRLSPSDT